MGDYNRTTFFNTVRSAPFGGTLSQSQVDGMEGLLRYADHLDWHPDTPDSQYFLYWLAYLLATTFHETYPGHHMQVYVAIEGAGVHPVLKYFYTSGLGEGWALYSERLADEAGLYTADVDRLGMLSNEAFRAARLVVDPGIHVLGWTRQQAEDYMLANTAASPRRNEEAATATSR